MHRFYDGLPLRECGVRVGRERPPGGLVGLVERRSQLKWTPLARELAGVSVGSVCRNATVPHMPFSIPYCESFCVAVM